ncbi:MAG TPA: serine/threonine-protein kinase [Pyrinomonadaceae bacterium]|jgi:serine/threonine-protein kinase|nr:serine/threonine-protein kinase [Pyrinomonadaceae bacterium]
MLKCPQCGREFPSGVEVCPDDGSTLRADPTVSGGAQSRPTPAPDPLIGVILDDKYRLDELLGQGGMGAVYRATHLLIERPVAVKVLSQRLVTDESARERFRREARAAGRLQHTNAVAVTDFGETRDGLVYLVMELLEGRPLREVLAGEAPLDAARAVSLMMQISAAVEAAHEAGIIHRDLKPGNIFLVQRPDSPYIVKVLDFGIAKLAASDGAGGDGNFIDTLTGTGVMIGTPRYMSPEQCDGAQLTPASDVYSLGVILYEMLAGQTPFTGTTPLALALKHSSESPRPPRELVATIPPALEGVVLHALEKKPGERASDAGEFRRELFAVAERLGLEHSAGFSAPTIETLRDAGTETPSGRLVIDIERLRRNRAANHTAGAGAVTDEEVAPETSDLFVPSTGAQGARAASSELGALEAAASSDALDEGVASSNSSSEATPSSFIPPAPVVPLSQTQVEAARVEVAEHLDAAGASAPFASSSSRARPERLGARGGRPLRGLLTHPHVLVVIICLGLLLIFGALLWWRTPARSATVAAGQSDEADEALGRTLASVDSAPRGTQVAQPRTAAEFYENGTYNFSVRNYDAAARDFRQALTLQPVYPSAHNRLGRTLMLQGQSKAAAEEFRKAIEQNGGTYPVAQFNLGVALQQTGDTAAAAAAYLDAIKAKGGKYPDAFYQLGVAYSDEGRWPEAADALRKSIEQDGGRDPDAQLRLGYVLVKQEDYAGAERVFRDALERRGGNLPYAHYNLGLLYEQTGRLQEAVAEFETFLQQAPRDENRYRVENTLRDLRRRAARESKRQQQQNERKDGNVSQ